MKIIANAVYWGLIGLCWLIPVSAVGVLLVGLYGDTRSALCGLGIVALTLATVACGLKAFIWADKKRREQ